MDKLNARLTRLYAQLASVEKSYDAEAVADAIKVVERAVEALTAVDTALQSVMSDEYDAYYAKARSAHSKVRETLSLINGVEPVVIRDCVIERFTDEPPFIREQ
jgi:hypothetical protein